MKPTITLEERPSIADQLEEVCSNSPTGLGTTDDRVAGGEIASGSDENVDSTGDRTDSGEDAERSADVPDHVRRLFDRWEAGEFAPWDFQTEVAVDSLESEVGYTSLFRQLQADYLSEVAYLRSEEGGALGPDEACKEAFRKCTDSDAALRRLNKLLSVPVKDLRFVDVLGLHSAAPRTAEQFWEMIKVEGRREFESGHMAATHAYPMDHGRTLWNIAKYLGVRESFIEEWDPRGGIEVSLVDALAQSFFQWESWMEKVQIRSVGKPRRESDAFQYFKRYQNDYVHSQSQWERGEWDIPMQSEAEAVEHAAQIADRFHRMYVRTLKAMRDHRRYSPVVIAKATNVNIATDGGQQINLTKSD